MPVAAERRGGTAQFPAWGRLSRREHVVQFVVPADVTLVLTTGRTTHESRRLLRQVRCAAEWGLAAFRDCQVLLLTPEGLFEVTVGDGPTTSCGREETEAEAASEWGLRLQRVAENVPPWRSDRVDPPVLDALLEQARHQWLLLVRLDVPLLWEDVEHLLGFAHDYPVVTGYRLERPTGWRTWAARFGRWVQACLGRVLFGVSVRDWSPPVQLLDRSVLKPSGGGPSDGARSESLELQIWSAVSVGRPPVAEVPVRLSAHWVDEADPGESEQPACGGGPDRSTWAAVRHWLASCGRLVRCYWNVLLFPAEPPVEDGDRSTPAAPHAPSDGGGLFGRLRRRLEPLLPLLTLLVLTALVLLPHLSYPFVEPDETRNAQIALEMYQSGDWVSPTRLGRPYLDKPPMLFWCLAASYKVFGPSAWAARLPVALASLLTVLVTYGLGCRLLGRRAAWMGALVLASSIGFVLPARFLIHDALLTFFVTSTWWLLWLGSGPTVGLQRRLLWAAAGALCGLGVLTKGPVSLVLTVPPLVALCWLRPDRARASVRDWAVFLLAAALCAAPWYVAASLRNERFFEYFVWKQNIGRFLSGSNHPAPWWFYIPVVFAGLFPASLLLPALVVYLCARSRELAESRHWGLSYPVLTSGWTLLFFTLSEGKLPTYVLPAAPMLALLLGHLVHVAFVPERPLPTHGAPRYLRDVRRQAPLLLLALAAASGVVGGLVDWLLRPDAAVGVLASLTVAAVCTSAAWWFGWVGRCRTSTRWTVAALAALVAVSNVFNDVFPDAAAYRSYLLEAAEHASDVPGLLADRSVPIVFFGRDRDSWEYYFPGHPAVELQAKELQKLTELLRRQPRALVVAEPHNARKLREVLPPDLEVQPLSRCVLVVRGHEAAGSTAHGQDEREVSPSGAGRQAD